MRKALFAAGALSLVCGTSPVRAEDKPDYSSFARRIQEAIVARMPRQFEDLSEWGKTIPLPADVRFPRLRRTAVKVGDHYEVPHGIWTRTRVWINDPAKSLQIQIRDSRKIDKNTTRLRVDATVAFQGQRERQRWVKGVSLFDISADADAVVAIGLDCDVKVAFDTSKFPPALRIEATVVKAQLALKEFNVRRVGPVVVVEQGELGEELKRTLQERLKTYEPQVKEYANRAIAESLKGGKGLGSRD